MHPKDSLGQEVEWGGQDAGRGDREGGGGGRPDLPRGVPARGRPGVSDHAAGSSGTGNGGAQAPGRAERGVPGARMSLALALWKGQAAAAAALWGARSLLLPVSERAGLSGRGWPWWSRVFLSKAIRQRLAARSPLGHTEARAAAPPGPGLGAGGAGAKAPHGRPTSGCRLHRLWLGLGRGRPAGLRRGKLREKSSTWLGAAGEGRRPPPVPAPTAGRQVGRPRAGGEFVPLGATALPEGASKSFKGNLRPEPGRLLRIPDRCARRLLLDASRDKELTPQQGGLLVHQAWHLIHLCRVPQMENARQLTQMQDPQQPQRLNYFLLDGNESSPPPSPSTGL
nr:insulin receptor substrate 4 isoform X2 [Pan troglodytes]